MLAVTELTGFTGRSEFGPVSISRTTDTSTGSASGGTLTFSSLSIGTAHADRIVCLGVAVEGGGYSINSATIDYGTGAITMAATAVGTGNTAHACVFYSRAPTGTTATFTVDFGSAPTTSDFRVMVYTVNGASPTPAASGADSSLDMDATDPLTTGSITIPTDGGFLAVIAATSNSTAKTWTNATEDLDAGPGSMRYSSATQSTPGSVTVTCQGTSNGEDGGLAWIVFNPI